jgi:hypothetical protein
MCCAMYQSNAVVAHGHCVVIALYLNSEFHSGGSCLTSVPAYHSNSPLMCCAMYQSNAVVMRGHCVVIALYPNSGFHSGGSCLTSVPCLPFNSPLMYYAVHQCNRVSLCPAKVLFMRAFGTLVILLLNLTTMLS